MLNKRSVAVDLCVVGGGLAGISTAISAARAGISVALIHERPVLGGNASSEIRMWVCGAGGENRETGLIEEIILENQRRNPTKNYYIWDTILFEFVKKEKNIQLFLNATCMDAEVEKGEFKHGRNIKIKSVTAYQMTTQRFISVEAKLFADCSGDSILAPLTGAEFMLGREDKSVFGEPTGVERSDDKTMGMSCLVYGRETGRRVDFIAPDWAITLTKEDLERRPMNIYNPAENFWYLELGGDRDSIGDTEEVRDKLLALAMGVWDEVKNGGSQNADNFELDFLGFLPGKRESRRMLGEYVLTANDVLENRDFADVIAYGGWPIDDHFPGGYYHKGTPNTDIHTPAPYKIPYRSTYSKNVENLFFAGRNISMSHMAMSSVRVMATCSLIGAAVGFASAVAVKRGLTPHDVYLEKMDELQDALMENDYFLPGKTRRVGEACKNARIMGAGDWIRDGLDRNCGKFATKSDVIKNGSAVEYAFKRSQVRTVRLTFDSDLRRDCQEGHWCEKTHPTRANTLLNSPDQKLPCTLVKEFVVIGVTESGEEQLLHAKANSSRYVSLVVNKALTGLKFIPLSNWGGTELTPLISFDFN